MEETTIYTNENTEYPNTHTFEDAVGSVEETDYRQEIASYETMNPGQTPYIALGNDYTYSYPPQDLLTDCLYTFTQNDDGTYQITGLADGTPVYVRPYKVGQAGNPQTTESGEDTKVNITQSTVANAVNFSNANGYLHFHRQNDLRFDQVNSVNNYRGACAFYVYRPVQDGETSSEEIPGYVRLSGNNIPDQIVSGEQYLIVAGAQNAYYVMHPSTGSSDDAVSKSSHVAKIALQPKQDLTFTAVSPGETKLTVGNTDYHVTVKSIITMDPMNGDEETDQVYALDDALNLPTPKKENHHFLGWFTEPYGGEQIDANTVFDQALFAKIKDDMHLYAHWEEIKDEVPDEEIPTTFTITLNPNGGTLPSIQAVTITVEENSSYTFMAPKRAGYKFLGWYTWKNELLPENTITAYQYREHGTELFARWEEKSPDDPDPEPEPEPDPEPQPEPEPEPDPQPEPLPEEPKVEPDHQNQTIQMKAVSQETKPSGAPNTGDSSNEILLWWLILISISGIVYWIRKRKNERIF